MDGNGSLWRAKGRTLSARWVLALGRQSGIYWRHRTGRSTHISILIGRNTQPPNAHLPLPRRLHRVRRRNPRRRRRRLRLPPSVWPHRLPHLGPPHSRFPPALGNGHWPPLARSIGTGHHDWRSIGRRGFQQRVWTAQLDGLFQDCDAAVAHVVWQRRNPRLP